jgi:hypothetical protein
MISCTEFIPAYSELFAFLEHNWGREQVDEFWDYLFAPTGDGIPLINFVLKEGIRGCYSYWSGTLNEEAADFTMYLNEKAGWFKIDMHRCPSKGRLLELRDEIGIEPYHDYCLHCFCYKYSLEKIGLEYIYDFTGTDHAACSILIYDPKVFDGRIVITPDTLIMDRKAADNEYFHPDFHSSLNMGVEYLGTEFGVEYLMEYLVRFTKNVYRKVIEDGRVRGLAAIEDKILDTYKKEHASDAVSTSLVGNTLNVKVAYCPGVKHLKATGRKVSAFYGHTTAMVMGTLASEIGASFELTAYDHETGAAEYRFTL